MDLINKLKKYFEETPIEEIKAAWAETKDYDKIGPTIEEFLEAIKTNKEGT